MNYLFHRVATISTAEFQFMNTRKLELKRNLLFFIDLTFIDSLINEVFHIGVLCIIYSMYNFHNHHLFHTTIIHYIYSNLDRWLRFILIVT